MPGKRTVHISNAARLWTSPQGHKPEIPHVWHTSPGSCWGRRTHCLPGALAEATSAVCYRQNKMHFWRKELMIPWVPKPWVQNIPRKENSTSWKCNRMNFYNELQLFWLLYRVDKEIWWCEIMLLQGTGKSRQWQSRYTIHYTLYPYRKLQWCSLNSKWPDRMLSNFLIAQVPF